MDLQREYQFWTGILADHARFIVESLKPDEEKLLLQAREFHLAFGQLQEAARHRLEPAAAMGALQGARSLIGFKQHLLDLALEQKVGLHMAPNLLNHMIQEGEQFLKVAEWLREGQWPPLPLFTLDAHNLWLTDAAGHAAALQARLDPTEAELRQQAAHFEHLFNGLHRRAWELWRMLERHLRPVPALRALTRAAIHHTDLFRQWLERLARELVEARVLTHATPLLVEHMVREEMYYLEKLRAAAELAE